MKRKSFYILAILTAAISLGSLIGFSMKQELNQIFANNGEYSITLDSNNGKINDFKYESNEKNCIAKTANTLNETTFSYINAMKSKAKYLCQLKGDRLGEFYNKDAITNITKITINANNESGKLYYYLSDTFHPTGANDDAHIVTADGDNNYIIDKLKGDDYFFTLKTYSSFAEIISIRIDYSCSSKYDPSLKRITFDEANAKYTGPDCSGTHVVNIGTDKYTFYGGFNQNSYGMLMFPYNSILYCADKYIGLSHIEVSGTAGFTIYCGPFMYPSDESLAAADYKGKAALDVPEGNPYFLISANTDFVLFSIKLVFKELVPEVQ